MRWIVMFLTLMLPAVLQATPYDQATKLIANGKKQQAWDILYPLAAKESDARAQIILGQMLLSSPGVEDYMAKALRMFSAAKRNGHPAADRFVRITQEQMNFSRVADRRRSTAERYYTQAEAEYRELSKKLNKGFLNGQGEIFAARVDVFIDGDSTLPSKVENLVQRDSRLSSSVMTTYHLVFDRENIGTANPFSEGFEPPAQGLEPDIDGALATKLGVKSFPAVVVREAADRNPQIMTFDQLQHWSTRWRKNVQ